MRGPIAKRRSGSDIERQIEAALAPGAFIGHGESSEFIADLERVRDRIAELAHASPALAAELYETFLAGAHAKVDEVDDSDGMYGPLVRSLFAGWVSARQESGADAAETARWLADRFDDERSIMYSISEDILAAFDGPGRTALETEARARRDRARGGTRIGIDARSIARRRWTEILGDVLIARRQVDVRFPRFRGHPGTRDHARGVFDGEAEAKVVQRGVQGGGRAPLPGRRQECRAGREGLGPDGDRAA